MEAGSFERESGKPIEYEVRESGCWHCTSHPPRARGYYALWDSGRPVKMHRWIFEHEYGPIPEGLCVCHTCDNNLCINPEHLFLGTIKDNMQDKVVKHRMPPMHGDNAPNHKLSVREALAIRESKGSRGVLSERYGVAKVTVDAIRACRLWKNYMTSGVVNENI